MTLGPIIDSHLHLWDPKLIRYPWLENVPLLNRAYLPEDFRAATGAIPVESMIFIQCEAVLSAFDAEAAWVAELTRSEPRIKGLVAWAPLDKGRGVERDLERLTRHSILRGIRRIIQFEPDLDFCLRPDFIEGVRTLKDFNLSFDICIDHRHMANILRFAERLPEVSMVLDHIGKPAIKEGVMHPWANQLRELACFPHVSCKISGVATEADHQQWTGEQLKPYIEVAIEAFGVDRIMFGGDWPVSTQAIDYGAWIQLLEQVLAGMPTADQTKFWHQNASRFYHI